GKKLYLRRLKVVLNRAFYLYKLEKERYKLQKELSPECNSIIGTSDKMQIVLSEIKKVAKTDVPVLITGESGTGKELVARAIHEQSNRSEKAFVAINCGAIPENLLESELFGHEKGAFTGAHAVRKGRIELADRGTLFLDEIGELPMHLQVKLLRFLQEQSIVRIGGNEEIPVDVRIVSATNVDLEKAILKGNFREDLYFRISVVNIKLPPLRDRGEDLMLLANYFLHEYAMEYKKNIKGFSKSAIEAMKTHRWRGNVRELKNRIKRAVIMTEKRKITHNDLELDSLYTKYDGMTLKEAKEELERELIQKALHRNRGNISRAASDLGISRPTLY
ncbi:MAG: sigma-54-dependent Fis family transcriptional regulator, partial [Nitrospirae bacterium]